MSKILYGNILYSIDQNRVEEFKNQYLVIKDSLVFGIYKDFSDIPEDLKELPLENFKDKLIIPGFVDLHLHAPQFPLSGFQMDLELLDWLNSYVFPEESKYSSLEYANEHYDKFVDALKNSLSCYFSIFGTIHSNSDLLLMEKLEKSGLVSYVGKVNMDRNSPAYLIEETDESIKETLSFIAKSKGKYKNTYPIITPRFIPSCTDRLMSELGRIAKENNLSIQSHLDENPNEIKWVKELLPNSKSYTEAYSSFNCLNSRTIMAHCVWNTEDEIRLIKESGAYIAHCPTSNNNLSSGIAPIRKYLNEGLRVGLGSDIAGGHTLDMLEIMNNVIAMSKMYWRYKDQSLSPLSFKEAFYLATAGGGEYFGPVGRLMPGYEASLVVLDDSRLQDNYYLDSLTQRLERISYTKDYSLAYKLVRGKRII